MGAVAGVDPEMKQAMKGKAWYFGMKPHVGTDCKGRVHHVTASHAATHDITHSFHIVKNPWGFTQVRYRGPAKNLARAHTMFGLASLYSVRRQLLPKGVPCRL